MVATGGSPCGAQPTFVAHLDVEAATTYHFQVVAGDAGSGAVSDLLGPRVPGGLVTVGHGLKLCL
jgi:hypothetical protein